MRRLALFISGTGGNALNLLRACREGGLGAEPVLGIASSASALGIQKLEAAGLPVAVVLRSDFGDADAFSEACYQQVEAAGAELIVLCGWLKQLAVPERWANRILNIHPGLLPQFGGPGMYGMHVHRAVLAAGALESGCTVHLVDNLYDHGQVLAVAKVPVLAGDSAEDLQQRVYAQEMALYPRALADFLARV